MLIPPAPFRSDPPGLPLSNINTTRAAARGEVLALGQDMAAGMRPQAIVPGGCWQGSRLLGEGRFALLGATMAPGFDYEDFELGEREPLARAYPDFRERITALTK